MQIQEIKRFNNATVVHLILEIFDDEKLGKVNLTPRWLAAGKSLQNLYKIPPEQKLVQIDASNWDAYGSIREQHFTFYYLEEIEDAGRIEKEDG